MRQTKENEKAFFKGYKQPNDGADRKAMPYLTFLTSPLQRQGRSADLGIREAVAVPPLFPSCTHSIRSCSTLTDEDYEGGWQRAPITQVLYCETEHTSSPSVHPIEA